MNTLVHRIDREFHGIMVCAFQLLLPATSKCALRLRDGKCLVVLGNRKDDWVES
jgi:hypothetical protein